MSEPSAIASVQHTPVRCHARSKQRQEQCRRTAIPGGTVCRYHGGNAPQVKAKAEQRLREMVDPMLSKLYELSMQTDNLKVASECVRDALDRAGIGELVQAKVRASHKQQDSGTKLTVQIGFLSTGEPATVSISEQPQPLGLTAPQAFIDAADA